MAPGYAVVLIMCHGVNNSVPNVAMSVCGCHGFAFEEAAFSTLPSLTKRHSSAGMLHPGHQHYLYCWLNICVGTCVRAAQQMICVTM